MKITRTTTPIIDAISKIHITGNITPRQWYKRITIKMRNGNTKPDLYAINLLSEILYWYRPMEVRDESTGEFIGYKRRFDGEYLQRSYASIGNMFGVSKDTAKDTVDRMKAMGLVGTIVKDIQDRHGNMMFNALHIYPIPEAIAELASSDCDDCSFEVLARPSPVRGGGQVSHRGGGQVSYTNTESTVTETTKEKEEIGNFPRSPLAGDCSQTSNKFDVGTNIDAKPQRENENDTSEYLKAKSAKQKAAPKPKAKPAARAQFANQVDRDDYPCTKAALYAIERHVAQSGGKHNFWVDANTSRPVIQLAHIEQVERNLTDLAEYFDTMPGTIPEIAASLMMEMYEVRGAKHKVKGKKTPVDLAFLACIGLKDPHTGCDFEGQDLCGWFANSSGT